MFKASHLWQDVSSSRDDFCSLIAPSLVTVSQDMSFFRTESSHFILSELASKTFWATALKKRVDGSWGMFQHDVLIDYGRKAKAAFHFKAVVDRGRVPLKMQE